MRGRRPAVLLLAGALLMPGAAAAAPVDTTDRTIRDTDGDNLLEYAKGERLKVVGRRKRVAPPSRGSLINFLQLSDFQIVDEESPGRVEFLDSSQDASGPTKAAYRPMETLTTQVAEAMVRAIRGARSPLTGEPLDLTILTGDNADNQQYNEIRWFIDILDGGASVSPDSGVGTAVCPANPDSVYDGLRGGGTGGYYEPDSSEPGEDGDGYSPDREVNQSSAGVDVTVRDFTGLFERANEPFRSEGLGMPWYTAFGNHDALVQGNSPEAFGGPQGESGESFNPGYHGIVTGCAKPTQAATEGFFGDPTSARIVPPDEERCFLAKNTPVSGAPGPCAATSFIDEHFVTSGTPAGHGFLPTGELSPAQQEAGYGLPFSADANDDGYYSFSPRGGLRFIVLDTITDECGTILCSEGSIDDAQFLWMADQIERATSMRQYVIVFGHHTLRTIRLPSDDATEQPIHDGQRVNREDPSQPAGSSPAETLEELFCRSPNVIAHVAGHEHENYLRHHTCEREETSPTTGTADFWEVATAAHIDWPQQARMIELIRNPRGRGMWLALTLLDHAGPPEPVWDPASADVLTLASVARELAYNDFQNNRASRGDRDDRNVVVKIARRWPPPASG